MFSLKLNFRGPLKVKEDCKNKKVNYCWNSAVKIEKRPSWQITANNIGERSGRNWKLSLSWSSNKLIGVWICHSGSQLIMVVGHPSITILLFDSGVINRSAGECWMFKVVLSLFKWWQHALVVSASLPCSCPLSRAVPPLVILSKLASFCTTCTVFIWCKFEYVTRELVDTKMLHSKWSSTARNTWVCSCISMTVFCKIT